MSAAGAASLAAKEAPVASQTRRSIRSLILILSVAVLAACGSAEREEIARLEAEKEALRSKLAEGGEDAAAAPEAAPEEKPATSLQDDWSWAEAPAKEPEREPERTITPAPVPKPESPPAPKPQPAAPKPEPKPEPTNRFETPEPEAAFEPEPEPEPRYETRRAAVGSTVEIATRGEWSSQTASVGDPVEATLDRDLLDEAGRVVLPAGTVLSGRITDVQAARKVKKKSRLAFHLDTATLPDGRSVAIAAGRALEGDGWKKKDGAVIGGAAAGGAVLGQVLGGDSESTAAGAALGGAIASGILMSKKGEPTIVPDGSILALELEQEVLIEQPLG
jgi:outer membrane biosynthesis protein TonB